MLEIKSYDEVAICRTCMGECSNYRSVHKEGVILGKTQTIACMIKYCTGLDVRPEDDLPDMICERCLQMLAKSYTFKESVLEANQKLVEEYGKRSGDSEMEEEELESQGSDEYEDREELDEIDPDNMYCEELSTEEQECEEFMSEEIEIVDDQLMAHMVTDDLQGLADAAQMKRSMDDEEYLMVHDEWQNHESAPGEEVGAFEIQQQEEQSNDDEANVVVQRLEDLYQIDHEVILEETVVEATNILDEDTRGVAGQQELSVDRFAKYQPAACNVDDIEVHVDVDDQGRINFRRRNSMSDCATNEVVIVDDPVSKNLKADSPPLERKRIRKLRPPNPDWKCRQCGKQLSNCNSYKYHMQLHSDISPYLCTLCGERFKTRNAFDGHLSMHDPNNPNTCKDCGKSYRQSSSLRSHMLTHTGERPYRCDICGKGMTQKSGYKKHMLTHTGEKPHSCDVCGREFRYSSNLFAHKRCHTGERPYMCTHCDKTFTTSEQVKRHAVVHTGERPYTCEVCGKTFKRSSSLVIHRNTHNPNTKTPELVNEKVAKSKVVELY